MKSYDYRNSELFLRDKFYSTKKYELPIIFKQDIDVDDLNFLGYQNTRNKDQKTDSTIHFFMDDYKFGSVWSKPNESLNRLRQYKQVITPDFSIYANMPIIMQMNNVFKRRWVGAYWQSQGLKVIPSVGWSDERSFDFCFDGIEKGSVVAISTLGAKRNFKYEFLKGYMEMRKRIEPEKIICYCTPFDEIKHEVIHIEHEARVASRLARARRDA